MSSSTLRAHREESSAPMTASPRRVVRLEHRLTQPNASLSDLDTAVALAEEQELAALTVSPWLVKAAKRQLGRSRVELGTVVAYPHGGQLLSVKAFEASKALEQGATQIDFAMNAGALASGVEEFVEAGHEVTVYDDLSTGHRDAVLDPAHLVVGDIRDGERLERLLRERR